MSNGAVAAASAAAARKKREREAEEEELTKYNADDLEGWEFKIVRAVTGKFKNPETLKRVCEEESRAGWELLEKFDNSRLRFKRRIENRSQDKHLQIDPYRTHVGIGEGKLAFTIVGAIAIIVAVIIILFGK